MKKILFLIPLMLILCSLVVNAQLVSEWKFDEGSGATASDLIGNNDGSIIGATWETTDCIQGNCLSFDGENDFVSIPSIFHNQKNTATISLWLKTKSNAINQGITGGNGDAKLRVQLYPLQPGVRRVDLVTSNMDNTRSDVITSIDLSTGAWYHLVFVIAPLKREIYINANKDEEASGFSYTHIPKNLSIIYIGRWKDKYWNGTIDEVQIYDFALTDQKIQDIYDSRGYVPPALDCPTILSCSDYQTPEACETDSCKSFRTVDEDPPVHGCYNYTADGTSSCEYCGLVGKCSDYPTELTCKSDPCTLELDCAWAGGSCYKPLTDAQGNDCSCPEGTKYGACSEGFQITVDADNNPVSCTCTSPDDGTTMMELKVPCRVTKKFPFFSPISIILALILLVGYYVFINKRKKEKNKKFNLLSCRF